MNWMYELNQVYNNNQHMAGVYEERQNNQRIALLPVGHIMQTAHVTVLINQNSEFVSARVTNKDNARTITPATIHSESRAAKPEPHYLHDKLTYVAGDYSEHGGSSKYEHHHALYKQQIEDWASAPGAPEKVRVIRNYIQQNRVIRDLISAGVLYCDENGHIINTWTDQKTRPALYQQINDVAKSVIRFDVQYHDPDEPPVWEDTSLFRAFIDYYTSQKGTQGLCYITGNQGHMITKHGRDIRHPGDGTKLISSNDTTDLTYLGRMQRASDAVQISYEASQKAHRALKWLIERQGIHIDSRTFVAFGVDQPDTVNIFEGAENPLWGLFDDDAAGQQAATSEITASEVNKALQSRSHTLDTSNPDRIIMMGLDSTGPKGRLSLVYYQAVQADLFYDAIRHWHETCRWHQTFYIKDQKKVIHYIGTPSVYQIAKAVYGERADAAIKKHLHTRLLPCITNKQPIPNDIVRLVFNRVCQPMRFKQTNELWSFALNIACALIHKSYEKEGYGVTLQENNTSRDYLFGRLLGIAEVMERQALKQKGTGQERPTNATRYFNAFAQRPARTWSIVRRQLTPYFEKMPSHTGYFKMLIEQIEDKISPENMTDRPLSPLFLMGYSSQVQQLYTRKGDR